MTKGSELSEIGGNMRRSNLTFLKTTQLIFVTNRADSRVSK